MIRFIEDKSLRMRLCRQILEALPEWFEQENGKEVQSACTPTGAVYAKYLTTSGLA